MTTLTDQLKRIKISEVFEYAGIKIERSGEKNVALCPFHNDTRPSLVLYDNENEKSFYHCFACNAHGDAIHFLKEKYGYDFKEAVLSSDN